MEKQINNTLPIFDLSIPQENIWLTEQLNENTDINHIYGTLFINKKMDIEFLNQRLRNTMHKKLILTKMSKKRKTKKKLLQILQ